MSNTASMLYIPPPTFKGTATFIENLKKFPPSGRLVIVSDHNYKSTFPNAEHISLLFSPERLLAAQTNRTSGISNALFVAIMREARKLKLSHVLYLESDCRVGQCGWDDVVLNEFFRIGFPTIAAGTIMAWNIFNGGREWITRYQDLRGRTRNFHTPVHTYGSFPYGQRACNPTLFPNGAAMVINVDWAFDLFEGFANLQAISTGEQMEGSAWDWQLGERARKRFGPDVFDLFQHLNTVSSCYGELALTEDYRLSLLREGKVCISHQHKGDKTV